MLCSGQIVSLNEHHLARPRTVRPQTCSCCRDLYVAPEQGQRGVSIPSRSLISATLAPLCLSFACAVLVPGGGSFDFATGPPEYAGGDCASFCCCALSAPSIDFRAEVSFCSKNAGYSTTASGFIIKSESQPEGREVTGEHCQWHPGPGRYAGGKECRCRVGAVFTISGGWAFECGVACEPGEGGRDAW